MATEQIDVVYPMEKEKEINRLANQHDVIKDAMRGLLFAKLDLSGTPLRILDSGTADGTWIRDLAASCPDVQHQYVGTDIDPSNFPANPPSRTTYQRQNINEEWPQEWKGSFDLVHQRLALAGGGSAQKPAVLRLVDLVKPGGWIQLIEATNVLPEGNGEVMRGFVGLMNDVFTIMGANLKLMEDLPGWLEEAGLVDVQSKLVELNLGPLNPNPRLATQGVYSTSTAATGLAKFAKTLPQTAVSLPPEKLDSLGADLQSELSERGGIYPVRVVWGRKPE